MPVNHYQQLTRHMLNVWGTRTPNDLLANSYLEHDNNRYWWVYDGQGREITKWECRPFPGCATLVVTTHIELREDLRGRGLGKYFHELRRKAYKAAGFQGEVCTVRSDSEAQVAIVSHEGKSMGTYPSDFGGTFNVWLLPLNNTQVIQSRAHANDLTSYIISRPVPVQIDTCGQEVRYPGGLVSCTRPPGHLGAHGPNPYVAPPTPVTQPAVSTRKPKTFSHRTPRT